MTDGFSIDAASRSISRQLGDLWLYIRPILALLVLWQVVTLLALIPEQALPTPLSVWTATIKLATAGKLTSIVGVTVVRVLLAFGIAVSIGFIIGMLMSQVTFIEWFFDPILSVAFPIPKVTLVPIYVLWFGFGTVSTVALAATSALFPVAISTYNGTKGVEREIVWSARSMGLSRLETSLKVIVPAALPDILNGVQISLFLSFVVVVVAEMVTSGSGLGRVLVESVRFFNTPQAIASVVIIAIFGLLFDKLFRLVRARLLWWAG